VPSVSLESANRNLKRVSVEAATDTSPRRLPLRPLRIELHGVYSVSLVRMMSCAGGGKGLHDRGAGRGGDPRESWPL